MICNHTTRMNHNLLNEVQNTDEYRAFKKFIWKEMATHSIVLPGKSHRKQRYLAGCSPCKVIKNLTQLSAKHVPLSYPGMEYNQTLGFSRDKVILKAGRTYPRKHTACQFIEFKKVEIANSDALKTTQTSWLRFWWLNCFNISIASGGFLVSQIQTTSFYINIKSRAVKKGRISQDPIRFQLHKGTK